MLHAQLTTLNAVSRVLATFQAEGLDHHALLAGSGISQADLALPDPRITTTQEMQVCANALALRPELGLDLGRRLHVSAYGILGYALLSSATLGDALRLALRYPALLGTFFRLQLIEDGNRTWLSADQYADRPTLATFNAELCLASLKVICDDLMGRPLALLEARFAHEAPAYVTRYHEIFSCPVHFEAGVQGFAFDSALLDQPLPLADAVTHRAMLERCRVLNSEFSGRQAWLQRARQLLADQLRQPPGVDGLARQLNCSARTLRRRLESAGTRYQDLLDELRFERARQWLTESREPIYQIADQLGFSETASFRHAFVRWSGVPPSHYRR